MQRALLRGVRVRDATDPSAAQLELFADELESVAGQIRRALAK